MVKIELNEQFRRALEVINQTSRNVFITGKAGTGKSTLLNYFRNRTKEKIVVLAPTGVAAINVAGQTIHSFFGFKPDVTLAKVKKITKRRKTYKNLDVIVIDEISMVRADLLDCIDKFMRLNGSNSQLPFGGVQMVFIGDLYQLPPVVTSSEKQIFKNGYKSEYFFDAKLFYAGNFEMEFIELEKVYRQKDERFVEILNTIRNNSAGEKELKMINSRFLPDFQESGYDFYIYLTPTNKASQLINEKKLDVLPCKLYSFQGEIVGDFKTKYLPTEVDLRVKVGAQVMLLNNDSADRWVNGTIGKIAGIRESKKDDPDIILVEMEDGNIEEVLPYTWEIFNFVFNETKGVIESEVVGSFTQYPFKLAWSVTIHKSQGKTFDRVIVDIGKGTFAHGQMYVALSRCTTLEGIVLKRQIQKKHIWMDWRVVDFVTRYQYRIADKSCGTRQKLQMIKDAIKQKKQLRITYLKNNDIKSRRIVMPESAGEMEYLGKIFLGVRGFCLERQEERVFRIDRILEIETM